MLAAASCVGLVHLAYGEGDGISMDATGYRTEDGIKYICKDESGVQLTIAGEDHEPNFCCTDESTPQYDHTDYTWSGGGSGSSASGTLETGAPGDFTPKCDLKHFFKCGSTVTGSAPTTESVTLPFAIRVVEHETEPCDPNLLPANPIAVQSATGNYQDDLLEYTGQLDDQNQQIARFLTGNVTGASGEEKFIEDGELIEGTSCGGSVQASGGVASASVGIPVTLGALSASANYTWSSYQPESFPGEPFKRKYVQVYKRSVRVTEVTFTGSSYDQAIHPTTHLRVGSQSNTQTHSGSTFACSSPWKSAGKAEKDCEIACCPGNQAS